MKTRTNVVILGIVIAASIILGITFTSIIKTNPLTSSEFSSGEEHYSIKITGMKKTYQVGEQYDFSYVFSGYGDPCGRKSVSFPDQDGAIQTMVTSTLCAAEVSLRDFVFDIQKERGVTYGHVKLKNPGTYNVTVSFEKLKEPAVFEFEVMPKETCSIQCLVYDPVCGKDGVTYGCGVEDAICHGVEVDYKGECNIPSTSSYMEEIIPTLDDFKDTLSEPYDIDTIFSKLGEPHDDIGSGIHIYVYELNDLTEIWIGYVDDIWYVKHVDVNGNTLEDLFAKNLENPKDCPISFNSRCMTGTITDIFDGDNVRVGNALFRLALVSPPELDEIGGQEAKEFLEEICPVGSDALVDQDDLRPLEHLTGTGRIMVVVYCNGLNLNEELVEHNFEYFDGTYCYTSEFADDPWAKEGCSK